MAGGPAESVFRYGRVPDGFAFGIFLLAFIFVLAWFVGRVIGFLLKLRPRQRRVVGNDYPAHRYCQVCRRNK